MTETFQEIKKSLKDPYFVALLVILGAAAFLRFKYAFGPGLWVDEGRYARAGFELSNHLTDYYLSWRGQVVNFPPVYSYLIALSTYLFGKTDFAVRFVSPIMGVAGVGLTYLLGEKMFDRDIGLVAAALLTVNPIFWFLSEQVLIAATLTTVYTLAILLTYYGLSDQRYSKYALWALGPTVAIAILTKQPAYTLGLVIPLYFLYVKKNEIKEVLYEDVEFGKTKMYETVTDINYYIGAGLGVLTLAPWMLRNTAVCGFPFCGLLTAADFASAANNPNAATTSVQGSLYFLKTMPMVITLPLAALLGIRVIQYILDYVDENPDWLVKYAAFTAVITGAVYSIRLAFVPLFLISSVSLLAKKDSEKLLWLWIGTGIGIMSIPTVKVPRYIVFTIPALLIISSISLQRISMWLEKAVDQEIVTGRRIMVLAVIPVLFLSYTAGIQNIQSDGFELIEPAGEWIASNSPENAGIVASSPAQTRYFAYPRDSYRFPDNESDFSSFILEKNISYVSADIYERTQPHWAQTGIPPYRFPNSVIIDYRQGRINQSQLRNMFSNPPPYLTPVKTFGRSNMPLSNEAQPVVIVYRVNRSAIG